MATATPVHPGCTLTEAWYPVDSPTPGSPSEAVLYGERSVVWSAGDGWAAAGPTCPHAGADLATGRVDEGRLVCPFHGWSFDATGSPPDAGRSPLRLRVRPVRAVDGQLWLWAGRRAPSWPPPAPADRADWVVTESGERTVVASLVEVFENLVDVEHFGPVHRTARAPVIERVDARGHRLAVASTQFFGSATVLRVLVEAHGPGATVTLFGDPPWLEMRAAHRPLDARRTLVRWASRAPAARTGGSRGEFLARLVRRLDQELEQDARIWARRDPSVDNRAARHLPAIRAWLAGFLPGAGPDPGEGATSR